MNEPNVAVNPAHYTAHKVLPVDLIAAYDLNFATGNVIKYTARHKEKNGREDLLKALWYLAFELGLSPAECKELTESVEEKTNATNR